ncbi:hypothetical protein QE152_g4304 [Popillia japonica]|uniref:Sarcospan n=1 Tax=Popillia japonica TaxID=7064 RepID=A0AAW1N1M8_POPJA
MENRSSTLPRRSSYSDSIFSRTQRMENRSSTLPRRSSYSDSVKNGGGNSNGSRPVSFYDNFRENGSTNTNGTACNSLEKTKSKSLQNTSTLLNSNREIKFKYDSPTQMICLNREIKFKYDSPTQMICLNTTVPQNIAASSIAGRHTPTRNSLRHSRMIVMSRMGKVPKKSLPPIIRFHKLAKALVGLQTVLGTALCLLSLWMLLWAPRLKARDNPYWSAFPLLLSGIVGLVVLCSCRKEYPGMSKGYCTYLAKVITIFLSTLAAITCLTACTFAVIHLLCLSAMECEPLVDLNDTCHCRITSKSSLAPVKAYHYLDLQCTEVRNVLTMLLIFSSVANAIGGLLSIWYIYLYWASRYMYTYSKVRTKDNAPIVISNS